MTAAPTGKGTPMARTAAMRAALEDMQSAAWAAAYQGEPWNNEGAALYLLAQLAHHGYRLTPTTAGEVPTPRPPTPRPAPPADPAAELTDVTQQLLRIASADIPAHASAHLHLAALALNNMLTPTPEAPSV